jgi:hypothetical protein
MHNETHHALLRYNIFAFFRSLLERLQKTDEIVFVALRKM